MNDKNIENDKLENELNREINFNNIVDELLEYEMDLFKYEIGQLSKDKIYNKVDTFDLHGYSNIRYLVNLVTLLKHSIGLIKLNANLQKTTIKYRDYEEISKIKNDIIDICEIALKGIDGKLGEFDIDTDRYLDSNSTIDKVLDMLKIDYNIEKNDDGFVDIKIKDNRFNKDNGEEFINALNDVISIDSYNPIIDEENIDRDLFYENDRLIHKNKDN